jgi:hypothetical protein
MTLFCESSQTNNNQQQSDAGTLQKQNLLKIFNTH